MLFYDVTKLLYFLMIFYAWNGFHAARHIDADRMDGGDGLLHILRRDAARQKHRTLTGQFGGA